MTPKTPTGLKLTLQREAKMITQTELKKLLTYNPETGDFTWLNSTCRKIKSGSLAGTFNSQGYRKIIIRGKEYKAHRLAWLYMYGLFPDDQIDHANGIRSDNRIENLRAVSNSENAYNRKKRRTNTSGVTGVRWLKPNKSWGAYINDRGKRIFLGLFEDLLSAVAARKTAERKYNYHPNHGRGV